MSNILNHNRDIFQFDINKEFYWDFHISLDNNSSFFDFNGLTERCLSAYIDLSDEECISLNDIHSNSKYVWKDAINDNTLVLNNFGYTSVDNGKTYYEKDKITNQNFFDLFTKTKFVPNTDDTRLTLYKIKGNNQIYDYTNDIALWKNKIQSARLNGGWFQGFFCANDGKNYKTLPTDIENGWNFEFVLNKENFENKKETLNSIHPENKGIFFYIGTRAENKWWVKYLTDHEFDWCTKNSFDGEYSDDYLGYGCLNDSYFKRIVETYDKCDDFYRECEKKKKELIERGFMDEYISEEYYPQNDEICHCEDCVNYVEDGYIEENLHIDENMQIDTDSGYDMYQPNIIEFKTDNKFLIFDRTCNGATADNWNEDTEFILNYIKKPNIGNYFTLFNRTCDGYDVNSIQKVLDIQNKKYNVLKDIYRNAMAFQIRDDGTLGYKFLVKDCESENENYKIESEFTKLPVITEKIWYTINVKIMPVKHKFINSSNCINIDNSEDKMQLYFYVNGKLVLVSRELPMLNLKRLDDLYEKQEGVPFNISLGGGTQGLSDVIYLNYMKLPEYILPLEKEFGGSFVGWIKSFKFYTCPLNYAEIAKNYNFTKNI